MADYCDLLSGNRERLVGLVEKIGICSHIPLVGIHLLSITSKRAQRRGPLVHFRVGWIRLSRRGFRMESSCPNDFEV